jgi:hypothetical protein
VDHDSFDRIARLLAGAGSRRAAFASLLGASLAGAAFRAGARNAGKARKSARKRKRRPNHGAAPAAVTGQAADCTSLESGSNLDGCDFSGRTLSGLDLHGSSMRGTVFAGANLTGANLSGSTMTGASFAAAKLCGANLRSSQLRSVDLRGADLTNANLASSGGCASVLTNAATIFCNTRWCNGTVRNPGCVRSCKCLANTDCASGICQGGSCVATLAGTCPPGADSCTNSNGSGFTLCGNDRCSCRQTVAGETLCAGDGYCADCADCQPGEVCVLIPAAGPCCGDEEIKTACMDPCPPEGFSCFVAGTRVAMADGTSRPIEQVAVGDRVLGREGVNRVVAIERPLLGSRLLYALNGGPFFVTAEHPFLTEDGWKAVDPAATAAESPDLVVDRLDVGDRLLALAGVAVLAAAGGDGAMIAPRLETVPLGSLIGMPAAPSTPLYNLRLDGDHAYFADELLVHNK